MWRKHFSALLNSSTNCGIGNFVQQYISSHSYFEGIDELMCNSFKIKSLLHKLPLNRAAGKDGIFAEHISYADSSVCNHLSSLFNVCLMHGKIPQERMQTVIVPSCKNKNGNISDAGNYRPVCLATIISKLCEHYILSCISPLLATTNNLSGFKPKHGTDMCNFLLKQTMSYYANKDTPVFSAFLDASKAFDRTNHNLLLTKLIKRNVPMCIVRLLLSLYRQKTMQVKWGTNYSSPFTVTNGVRQGGVLSPNLFAVYLDELSIQLGSARVGCTVANMVVNHLKFAVGICVFSPSISGLQCLLNICGDYAAEHEITFNCKKTIGVLFLPKKV